MLKDQIRTYYFDQNYNCAESLLRAANECFSLHLADRDMIMAAAFGGGMQTGETCGAVLAALSVLSMKYVKEKAHECDDIKPITTLFLKRFRQHLNGSLLCRDLRPQYFQPQVRCLATVEAACDALEETIQENVVSVRTMRESDAWTIQNMVSSRELMRRAGTAIFEAASWVGSVAVICGKGNNAGDGYVAASLMKEAGIDCTLILLSDSFSEDGQYYYDLCIKQGIKTDKYHSGMDLSSYGSILDCLLGTGFQGEVTGIMKDVIDRINESGAYVVSADINSGLNADTGEGSAYVKSDLTVSIGSYKYGHFIGEADNAMKSKVNCDIGIRIIR